jgi:hypothetical protein
VVSAGERSVATRKMLRAAMAGVQGRGGRFARRDWW